jgi:K+-transporting ATPase KdpF subunit
LASRFSRVRCFTPSPAIAFEESPMIVDYTLGAIVTVGLLIYLIYALIRPERF